MTEYNKIDVNISKLQIGRLKKEVNDDGSAVLR